MDKNMDLTIEKPAAKKKRGTVTRLLLLLRGARPFLVGGEKHQLEYYGDALGQEIPSILVQGGRTAERGSWSIHMHISRRRRA